MASLLLNLVKNLSERVHRIKCKFVRKDKKCEIREFIFKYCNCFLEYMNFKYDLIESRCLSCNKNYQHDFGVKLNEQNINIYKFSNHDKNKFNLLLQKSDYPYEYMDDWEKFNEKHHYQKKKLFIVT